MASQLLVDLYECDVEIIDNMEKIKNLSHKVIKEIGSEIVEECFHKFSPIGITYIAVITTSHFSIHTWPEYKYVAVDVFSCDEELPDKIVEELKVELGAKRVETKRFERDIEGRSQG